MPLWLADQPLVLASKSAIRGAVLRAAGVSIEVHPADVDERAIEQGSAARDPGEVAALLAREKAAAVAARLSGRMVLGADQTLALGERRFSKPADRAAAREQLKSLRGRTHELHSAIALVREGTVLFEHREVARLTMRGVFRPFSRSLSRCCGSRGHRERRGVSARAERHPAVRARRGRSLHHSGTSAVAAAAASPAGGMARDMIRRAVQVAHAMAFSDRRVDTTPAENSLVEAACSSSA